MATNLMIGDKIMLVDDGENVAGLQRQANLKDIDYQRFKGRMGYVAGILASNVVKLNYVIDGEKNSVRVVHTAIKRVEPSSLNPPRSPAIASKLQKTQGNRARSIRPILLPINRNLANLIDLIKNEDADRLVKMCKNNPYINDYEETKKQTLYHLAISIGNEKILNILRNAKCNAYAVDIDGDSIMHYAIYKKKAGSINFILSNYQRLTRIKNNNSETPLLTACRLGNVEITIMLLNEDSSIVNEKNKCGNAAIHYAAANEDSEILQALLKIKCIDLSLTGENDKSPFHIACIKGSAKIVEEIIKHCRMHNIEKIINQRTKDNETGAQMAIRRGHIDLALSIIRSHPMEWSQFPIYSSILHESIRMRSLLLVTEIIKHDKHIVNIRDINDATPLDFGLKLYSNFFDTDIRLDGRNIVNHLLFSGATEFNELFRTSYNNIAKP